MVSKNNTLIILRLGAILEHSFSLPASTYYGSQKLPTRPYLVRLKILVQTLNNVVANDTSFTENKNLSTLLQ